MALRSLLLGMFLAGIAATSAIAADGSLAKADRLTLKRNYSGSAAVVRSLALQGDAKAQFRLGVLYRLGLGVPRNDQTAREWLERAAIAGNADAARLLKTISSSATYQTRNITPPWQKPRHKAMVPVDLEERDGAGNNWIIRSAARGLLGPMLPYAGQHELKSSVSVDGQTPLMASTRLSQTGSTAALLAAGTDTDDADKRGRTALMLAALYAPAGLTATLLNAGATTSSRDASGLDALGHAVSRCNSTTATLLVRGGASGSMDNMGTSPLHLAAQRCRDEDLVVMLAALQNIDAEDHGGRTPLWYAAAQGDTHLTELLIQLGADLHKADADGLSPLHAAASRARIDTLDSLLRLGASPSERTRTGNTALMLAAASHCPGCLKALLKADPDVSQKNDKGDTALLLAVQNADARSAEILLQAGADQHVRNTNRETAVGIARRIGLQDLLEILEKQ